MDTDVTRRPGIDSVVNLAFQVDSDRRLTAELLRRRDRMIGRELESLKGSPRRQVLGWLSQVSGEEGSGLGSAVARVLHLGTLLMGLLGMVLGGITAAAVFTYNGQQPVNVIHVLAVFVGLQLILVMVLALTILPRSFLRWIPGSTTVLETLSMLSPGRIQKIASRRLPDKFRHRAAALLGTSRAHRLLFGRMEKWLVVSSSQFFAVAFNGGALLCCLYLVFFSDLAFSWNTTLQITAADIHSMTSFLSAPWRNLVPDADPSLALIEASRYYRLKEGLLPTAGQTDGTGPALLGGWWPFLAMSMFVYGLLPRIALWTFSHWRLQTAVNATIVHLPGVSNLLERMNREFVATQAREAEVPGSRPPRETAAAAAHRLQGTSCALISWSDAPGGAESLSRAAARIWGCSPSTELLAAGGANSIAQDGEVIARAVSLGNQGGIVVFVRAWEPPLDEFLDFLGELRAALPGSTPIVVAPLGMGDRPGRTGPEEAHLDMWRKGLMPLGDPWLSIEPLREDS
jgi:hypothetical protein